MFQGQPYVQKSDIWTLGINLYHMIALKLPFSNRNRVEIRNIIISKNYPPLPDTYSIQLKNIVGYCLKKNPNDRPDID